MTTAGLAGILLAMSVAAEAEGRPPRMEPGLWEITVRIDMQGTPVREATQTLRHCYTLQELEDGRNALPAAGPGCEVVDYLLSGNRATWSLRCVGPNTVGGGGEMIFGAVAYAATVWNDVPEQGRILRVVQKIRAKHLGECLPEPAPE
ncbi:MAG TPA: DUF3617 family protein [Burkholderiales bacterium]|nr:DUF3617 family protein [Burkholderiales bacterium]